MNYFTPVDRSDVLVIPMCAYNSVLGLSRFHKQTGQWLGSIDSLRSPSASGAEESHPWLRQWHQRFQKPTMIAARQASGARSGYRATCRNHIQQCSKSHCNRRSICPTDWGLYRAAVSDFGRHHSGISRWEYTPRRWTWWVRSSGSSCGRRAALRRHMNDCYLLAETQREWPDCGASLLCWRTIDDKASWVFPSTAPILSWFFS